MEKSRSSVRSVAKGVLQSRIMNITFERTQVP